MDGDLNEYEMDCLKAIVLQLPHITFEDWKIKNMPGIPDLATGTKSIINDFLEKVFHKGIPSLLLKPLLKLLKRMER